jgi:transcriptional regulator NrdR family protein
MEYYGKCPLCGSYDIETIDTYEEPTGRGNQLIYMCKCNECKSKFNAYDKEEID